jgi:hypothetical protein
LLYLAPHWEEDACPILRSSSSLHKLLLHVLVLAQQQQYPSCNTPCIYLSSLLLLPKSQEACTHGFLSCSLFVDKVYFFVLFCCGPVANTTETNTTQKKKKKKKKKR